MSKSRHTEAQMIGALKQLEAGHASIDLSNGNRAITAKGGKMQTAPAIASLQFPTHTPARKTRVQHRQMGHPRRRVF